MPLLLLLFALIPLGDAGCGPCFSQKYVGDWQPDGQTCTECYVPGMVNNAPIPGLTDAIKQAFPESAKVSPEFISHIDRDLHCSDPNGCTFSITIQYEGAGYQSELGYILFDANGNKVSEKVLFPRAKIASDCLRIGATALNVGPFLPGSTVGFYLDTNSNCPDSKIHPKKLFSRNSLNKDGKVQMSQMVYGMDTVVIGFEDQYQGVGDDDYNDIMFSIDMKGGMSLAAPQAAPYTLDRLKELGCGPETLVYKSYSTSYAPELQAALAGKLWVSCDAWCVYDWTAPSVKAWYWDPNLKTYTLHTNRDHPCFSQYYTEAQKAISAQVAAWTNVDCSFGEWSSWSTCSQTCNGGTTQRNRYIRMPQSGTGAPCPESHQSTQCNTQGCPVDCVVSDWTDWSKCDKTCGTGQQKRSRKITVQPLNGGAACPLLEETQKCELVECPIDCVMNDWSAWSECDVSCGQGIQTQTRTVATPARFGGVECPTALQQTQTCNVRACPIDCIISNWKPWSSCDKTCGGGQQSRSRYVITPASNSGKDCDNKLTETISCNTQSCPVDCEVSDWSEWSSCDQTCGGGHQTRSRTIKTPAANGGAECPVLSQTETCNQQLCSVDCKMTTWSDWTTCDKSCGGGSQKRTRTVTQAAQGGGSCGSTEETQVCNDSGCPEDCEVSEWSAWSSCDRTCGGGYQSRRRSILKPAQNGGASCPILSSRSPCSTQECPVDCYVGFWDDWSSCDKTCGGGIQTRVRRILIQNQFGGKECPATSETLKCASDPCPVDCQVSDWTSWAQCDKTCGGGIQKRTRTILVQPSGGGSACPSLEMSRRCNDDICPVDCVVTDWSSWSECDKSCGSGQQSQTRTVVVPARFGGKGCPALRQFQACNTKICPTDCQLGSWSAWTVCDKTCGGGVQTKTRTILVAPLNDGQACGLTKDVANCNTQPCPVDCVVGDWTVWSDCDKKCGGGKQSRTRVVVTAASNGGAACQALEETQACNTQFCSVDCQVSDWSAWSTCDKTCGAGSQKRTRTILVAAANGGLSCAPTEETQACNTDLCPEDCEVSEWGSWSRCDHSCAGGSQNRARFILNPERNGGKACPVLTESQACNKFDCPVDCVLSAWSEWSACDKPCGGGSQSRQRTVVVEPKASGAACGALTESVACNIVPCPVDCTVSSWSQWSPCDKTCGSGTATRSRTIISAAANAGKCSSTLESMSCNTQPCDSDCQVGDWGEWSVCSAKCGGGERTRKRAIASPAQGSGKPCTDLQQTEKCNTDGCPIDCSLGPWSEWSVCDRPCAGGLSRRTRSVAAPAENGGAPCGVLSDTKNCNLDDCPTYRACVNVEEDKVGTLMCPESTVVINVDFASYGRPTGKCPSFSASTGLLSGCHADSSKSVVEGLCMGKSACSLAPTNTLFGTNPCLLRSKYLAVSVTCGNPVLLGSKPLPTPPETMVLPVFKASSPCDCNTFIMVDTTLNSVFWNMDRLKEFTRNLAVGLASASEKARAGIISFSWTVTLDSELTHDVDKLASAADQMSRNWGVSSNMIDALTIANSEFSKVTGCKRLIIYSDGNFGNREEVEKMISKIKELPTQVQVVAVSGWFNNEPEMKGIASSEDDYVSQEDFAKMPLFGKQLAEKCLKPGSKLVGASSARQFISIIPMALGVVAAVLLVAVVALVVVRKTRRQQAGYALMNL